MKKVLVVYYSQSGQLYRIIRSVLEPFQHADDVEVVYEQLQPIPPNPFPWTVQAFCDAFPEAFLEIPCELQPLQVDPEAHFDLVILAYTVWYLAPSTPISAFLQRPEARRIIQGKPVVTLIGCRNMWLLAQEKVKKRIDQLGGTLKGNIVLADRTSNLVGVITIAYWMFTGKKERPFKVLPQPGVSDSDIDSASRFGGILQAAFHRADFGLNQAELNQQGAVNVVPAYILFERRIAKIFRIWSQFIRQKGGPGAPQRQKRVRLFFYYLLVAIVVFAPLATVVSWFIRRWQRDKIQQAVAYYSQNTILNDLNQVSNT